MEYSLRQLRKENKFTQEEAAKFLGVSLRCYKSYETDINKKDSIKYNYMASELQKNLLIDEEHGILSIEEIKSGVCEVVANYDIEYCYLFGSYAKGKGKANSDVDLLISTNVTGLRFYGLAERLRERLHKKVDLLDIKQLENNTNLLNEILKYGIKIYG